MKFPFVPNTLFFCWNHRKIVAAQHKQLVVRNTSSSGGAFYAIASYVLQQGGVVIGAAWNQLRVEHIAIRQMEDIPLLQKSKYAPSSLRHIDILALLQEVQGAPLLFSGTPCQVVTIRNIFLRKHRCVPSNVVLLEVACHGVPTQQSFETFANQFHFKSIDFRVKERGWHNKVFKMTGINNVEWYVKATDTRFYMDYIAGNNLLPACRHCKYKYFQSCADMTLADFWGVEAFYPDMDDNKGTSLVFLHTKRAKLFWKKIEHQFVTFPVSLYQAIQYNPCIVRPIDGKPTFTEWFYQMKTLSLSSLYAAYKTIKKVYLSH